MDSQTHVEFATKLLKISGHNTVFSVASLFPQIDRHPHTLHRMYAHTVFKARRLTDIGLHVLENTGWQDPAHAFDVKRFKEETPRFKAYMQERSWSLPTDDPGAREAALLAYVSHLYLDTYNQPTQPFAPASVYCSGQWALWEKIGDFRLALYTTPLIGQLRQDLFAQSFWDEVDSLSANALIQAMLVRMCKLSLNLIDETIVAPAMRALALEPLTNLHIAKARAFLEAFEHTLNDLHIKHLLGEEPGIGLPGTPSQGVRELRLQGAAE